MKIRDNRKHLRFIGRVYNAEKRLILYTATVVEEKRYVEFAPSLLRRYNELYIFENAVYVQKRNSIRTKTGVVLKRVYGVVTADGQIQREPAHAQAYKWGIAVIDEPRRIYAQQRSVYANLIAYINGKDAHKLAVLAGLKRTGNTELLLQLLHYCVQQHIPTRMLTIQRNFEVSMRDVLATLDDLVAHGVKIVLIDEITLLQDFQICCEALIENYVQRLGIRIVVSGTASLSLLMPSCNEYLYDSIFILNTAYISFAEWHALRGTDTLQHYLQQASNLYKPDYSSRKALQEYIDTAIIRNIMSSVENAMHQRQYRDLATVYNTGTLSTIITFLTEGYSFALAEDIINDYFVGDNISDLIQVFNAKCIKSGETTANMNAVKDTLATFSYSLYLQQKPIEHATSEHIQTVKYALSSIGVMNQIMPKSSLFREPTICIQYGLVYNCAFYLMQSIREQLTIEALTKQQVDTLIQLVMQDVQGQLMEQMIQYETALTNDGKVDKFSAKDAGEIDMIVWHDDNTCDLYEIKRSDKCVENQTRWLRNEKVLMQVQQKYGKIRTRNVLYNGTTTSVTHDGAQISYINATDYLLGLK